MNALNCCVGQVHFDFDIRVYNNQSEICARFSEHASGMRTAFWYELCFRVSLFCVFFLPIWMVPCGRIQGRSMAIFIFSTIEKVTQRKQKDTKQINNNHSEFWIKNECIEINITVHQHWQGLVIRTLLTVFTVYLIDLTRVDFWFTSKGNSKRTQFYVSVQV